MCGANTHVPSCVNPPLIMKKFACWCICVSGSALSGAAQNLVPNGSFEQYTDCPEFISSVYLTGWENLHTNSADYFNSCNDGVAGVPLNQFGYQYASDGEGYVGMAISAPGGGPWYREIVGIELTEPLQPGVPVCLSFNTAMGGFGSWPGNSTPYSCEGLGLKFFMSFPSDWNAYLYPNSAALYIDFVPTDTALWYHVTGTYIPDSAYTRIAVGNFFADSLNNLTLIDSTGFGTLPAAYAFADDIRASFDLSYCDADLSIEEHLDAVAAFPMPCADLLNVRLSGTSGGFTYRILDIGYRMLRSGDSDADAPATVYFGDLPDGIYMLQISDGGRFYRSISVLHISP